MLRNILALTLLTLHAGLSNALILESGDGAEAWAQVFASDSCLDPQVAEVYICQGGVVKIVRQGMPYSFHRPDGRVVLCEDGHASDIGAECLQLMLRHNCPEEVSCSLAAPQEPTVAEGDGAMHGPQAPAEETTSPAPSGQMVEVTLTDPQGAQMPKHQSPAFDDSMSNLALLAALLGVIALIFLFAIFKASIEA